MMLHRAWTGFVRISVVEETTEEALVPIVEEVPVLTVEELPLVLLLLPTTPAAVMALSSTRCDAVTHSRPSL
jgi:ABC-type amino acid transport substrate-binding protein